PQVLGCRPPPGRARTALVRQAVRPRLAGCERLGSRTARARPALRGRRPHVAQVPRGLRARRRVAVRPLPAPERCDLRRRRRDRCGRARTSPSGARVNVRVEVLAQLKPGLLAPQGKAVEGSLPAMGWTNVSDVRVGRHVELTIDAESEEAAQAQVEEMASRLLSTPVIEELRVLRAEQGGR